MNSNSRNRFLSVFFFAAISLAEFSLGIGQFPPVSPEPLRSERNGATGLLDIESISPFSGDLQIHIPLLSIKGRGGVKLDITESIDPKWNVVPPSGFASPYTQQVGDDIESIGYALRFQKIGNRVWFVYFGPNGEEINLVDELSQGNPATQTTQGFKFVSTHGEGIVYDSDIEIKNMGQVPDYYWSVLTWGFLRLPDGTSCRIENGLVKSVFDRNGNKIDYNYAPIATPPGFPQFYKWSSLTDSVNRVISLEPEIDEPKQGKCRQFTYTGWSAQEEHVRVCYDELTNLLRSDQVLKTGQQLFPELSFASTEFFNVNKVSRIWLPDGRYYRFYYNSYGEVARIELPTGGAVEYDFGAGLVGGYTSGVIQSVFGSTSSSTPRVYRRLAERREYPDGGTGTGFNTRTTYSRPESVGNPNALSGQNLGYVDVCVFGANSVVLSYDREYYYGSERKAFEVLGGEYYSTWRQGLKYKHETFAADTITLLRRTSTSWQQKAPIVWWVGNPDDAPANNPRPIETVSEILDTSPVLVSKATHIDPNDPNHIGYDQYNNTTDLWEYDWGQNAPGLFLRRTHFDYVMDPTYTDSESHFPFRPYLRNLVSQTWISSNSDGTNKCSRTAYEYDNYSSEDRHAPLVPRGNASGRFEITGAIVFDAGYTTRGNLTSQTDYGDANNQTLPVFKSFLYDVLGNIVKVVDSNRNSTTIGYSDNFGAPDADVTTNNPPSLLNGLSAFAFPTSSTNSLNWTSHVQYDYYTGAPINSFDVNGVISMSFYADPFGRLTQTVTGVGTLLESQTTTVYDAGIQNKQTTTSDLRTFNDNLLKSESYHDGFGRVVETRRYEGPGDYVSVMSVPFLIVQDPLTSEYRAATKTSNPFRPNAGELPNWTSTLIDELGRRTKVIMPDGSVMKVNYSGNSTVVTDQAGKVRRSISNSLGFITRIDEPDLNGQLGTVSNPTQPSIYTYDVSGNLLTVVQNGNSPEQCDGAVSCSQTRSFTYDGLSRITLASNPELGTMSYLYDGNGNVTRRNDARGVQTDYVYDELNRIKEKNYSTPTGLPQSYSSTPDVRFAYDEVPNSKGKLTTITTGASGVAQSVTRYQSFDELGRVTQSQQWVDGAVFGPPISYVYNLSGALTEEKYPSGRIVANILNDSGMLAMVNSRKDENHGIWHYANSITYSAAGAVTSMQLGNGAWENTTFNNRLQAIQIALGTVQNGTDLFKLNYTYSNTGNADNNGNVLTQEITVHSEGQNNGIHQIQSYTYDSLNRLQQADEKPYGWTNSQCSSDPSNCWTQTFQYDRYGNKRFDETNTTFPFSFSDHALTNPSINPSKNRFTSAGYVYDSTGNTTTDATGRTFVYDAENKQTSVSGPLGTIGQYYYDANGKRIKSVVPGTGEATIFIYDATGRLIAEYSTIVASTQAKVRYLTSDHIGTPRLLTDENENVISRHDYHPFGEEIVGTGGRNTGLGYVESSSRKQFAGYERDQETGLDFAQARYYESSFGRFMSPDNYLNDAGPLDPGSWNLYVYARNNPLRFVDPSGKSIYITFYEQVGEDEAFLMTVEYRGGKLFNLDGSEYTGNNAYALKALEFLNTLSEDRVLHDMIRDLEKSKKINRIEQDVENPEHNETFLTKEGTKIFWSGTSVPLKIGRGRYEETLTTVYLDPIFSLAHELLGHAWYLDRGRERNQFMILYNRYLGGDGKWYRGENVERLCLCEIDAINIENEARGFLGSDLRVFAAGYDISDLLNLPRSSDETPPKLKISPRVRRQ